MKNASLHFQFSSPGNWGKFTMTAILPDNNGFVQSRRFTQDDIPADQAPALSAAVSAIASMGEDWQASQVRARLDHVLSSWPINSEDGPFETVEAISLTVEAVNKQGGRRIFTTAQYQEFTLISPAAVAFFKHFTNQ